MYGGSGPAGQHQVPDTIVTLHHHGILTWSDTNMPDYNIAPNLMLLHKMSGLPQIVNIIVLSNKCICGIKYISHVIIVRSGCPPPPPQPDYPAALSSLQHMDSEQLKEILNSEDKFDLFVRDLPQMKVRGGGGGNIGWVRSTPCPRHSRRRRRCYWPVTSHWQSITCHRWDGGGSRGSSRSISSSSS